MNQSEYEALNGERLLHTVWILRNGSPVGIMHQTVADAARLLMNEAVVKIECIGYTLESVMRAERIR